MSFAFDPCEKCEQMMQPYSTVLTERSGSRPRFTSRGCSYCRKRYRFEAEFRQFVRLAAAEPMPPELKASSGRCARPSSYLDDPKDDLPRGRCSSRSKASRASASSKTPATVGRSSPRSTSPASSTSCSRLGSTTK